MRKLTRRSADALRARIAQIPPPGKGNLGDYGGAYDHEYNEGDVFRSETPGALQVVNAQGEIVPASANVDPFRNPVSFTTYTFTLNNTSPNGTGNGSVPILSQNLRRQVLIIQNLSGSADLFVNFGTDAGLDIGLLLNPGNGIILDNGSAGCPNNSVYVFFNSVALVSGVIIEGAPVS